MTTTTLALASRWTPHAPREEPAFWAHLLGMLDQLLPLRRAILLERVEGDQRVREVAALRCELADIAERRRDFRRTPYATALAGEGYAEPEGFLKGAQGEGGDGQAGEQQVLMPLRAGTEVLGFWIFGVDRERLAARPTLRHAFQQVTDELAELLQARRADRRRGSPAERLSRRLADRGDAALQRLVANLGLIDRHLTMSREIFDAFRTPTLVYDLFGRTIAANRRMAALLAQAGLDPERTGAPALLAALCGMDGESAREVISGVAFEGHEFERTTHGAAGRHLLRATSLLADAPQRHDARRGPRVQGLVIEVIPLGAGDLAERGGVDVWQAFDHALARVTPGAGAGGEPIDFSLDGDRDLPRVAVPAQAFVEALTALLQLLADDARRPGVVSVRFGRGFGEVTVEMRNEGYAMPPQALEAALQGEGTVHTGPLRQIRALRETAFPGGRLRLEAELGRGYRVRIELPAAE